MQGHAKLRNMPKRERIALVACQAYRTRILSDIS
jgi:hypothetical protein